MRVRNLTRQAHLALFDFCNDTMSSFYLDATKDRLYCDRPDSSRRRATQTVLHQIADTLICLLAPILPHTAEEAHRALHGEDVDSVHLRTFPEIQAPSLDAGWEWVLETRDLGRKALEAAKADGIEKPFDAGLKVADPDGVLAAFEDDLVDLFGVSRVERVADGPRVDVVDLREAPRCERSWRRDATVSERADGGWLSDRDAEAVGVA
ncbi:MAG: class I tRNA ligase family protein [Acidobacteriota bacterium]